jgi:hypothetical protein
LQPATQPDRNLVSIVVAPVQVAALSLPPPPKPQPRTNPLELLSEASGGVVRAMSGAAQHIVGPGELRDQLSNLGVGDEELRAWGTSLRTKEGRAMSWPEDLWTQGDLRVIQPVVNGKSRITTDWLRRSNFGGLPWAFLRLGIEQWRTTCERHAERAAASAADRSEVHGLPAHASGSEERRVVRVEPPPGPRPDIAALGREGMQSLRALQAQKRRSS